LDSVGGTAGMTTEFDGFTGWGEVESWLEAGNLFCGNGVGEALRDDRIARSFSTSEGVGETLDEGVDCSESPRCDSPLGLWVEDSSGEERRLRLRCLEL